MQKTESVGQMCTTIKVAGYKNSRDNLSSISHSFSVTSQKDTMENSFILVSHQIRHLSGGMSVLD